MLSIVNFVNCKIIFHNSALNVAIYNKKNYYLIMENKCGQRIKQRLEELNMSQADLCRITGISSATMSQYVSGKYFPTQERLDSISHALKASPAYLMGWKDTPEPYTQEEIGSYNPLEDSGLKIVDEFFNRYSAAVEHGASDDISQLIDVALGLDDDKMQQLINYAKFLSQEDK